MNHYESLGVSKNASQKEIKDAYKKLIKKYHPDIYSGDKAFAEKKTKEINLAYDILSDEQSRKNYDMEIAPNPNYSYTPQKYNNPESYSYRNYYTSYEEYENYKRYSKYHRSKASNSNYTNTPNIHDKISNNILNSINKLSKNSKILILILVILIYCCFLVSTFLKFNSLFKGESTGTILNTHKATHSENISNSTNITNSIDSSTREDFDINQYINDDELKKIYIEGYTDSYDSYYEFKEAISDYIYYNYDL